MIRITCYGTTTEHKESERESLKREFIRAIMCSEGSERERYVNILIGLEDGECDISDEW